MFSVLLFAALLGVSGVRAQTAPPETDGQAGWYPQDPLYGDLWITENLYLDADGFRRYDTSKYAFGLNFRARHRVPGENDFGVVLWVAPPGPNPIPPLGYPGSLQVGWDLTQHKDLVVGGSGVEVDGNGLKPYARFVHARENGPANAIWTGIATNLFLNLIGRDDSSTRSWFMGFVDDTMKIRRAAKGEALRWLDYLQINPDGRVGIGTSEPKGALDVASASGGLVVPRLSEAERDAMKPSDGTMIYNTTSRKFNFFQEGHWEEL
jgi:hypothetical protein